MIGAADLALDQPVAHRPQGLAGAAPVARAKPAGFPQGDEGFLEGLSRLLAGARGRVVLGARNRE